VLDDRFKVRSHCVTEAGECNAGNTANEKLTAEFLFESLNGCAQRWLRDIAPSGRPREVQLLAHRKEVGDFARIHSRPRCSTSLPPFICLGPETTFVRNAGGHQRAI
jgi:hypothetical protein